MELNFRTLKAEEIDVRVGTVSCDEKKNKFGCTLLLYKDARVDMSLLDEVCKPFGWCREHKELKGVCYCGVGIKDTDTGEWVFKWDAGAESFSDKEKGEASDSFKRACVNWGIGRELYTAGFIWVNLSKSDFYLDNSHGYKMNKNIKFSVKEIEYDDKRQISKLIIVDQNGATCYTFPKKAYKAPKEPSNVVEQPKEEKPAEAPKTANDEDLKHLTAEQLEAYLGFCSDMDAAETAEQLKATVERAQGQPFYKHVRSKSITIATKKNWIKKQ